MKGAVNTDILRAKKAATDLLSKKNNDLSLSRTGMQSSKKSLYL
jgi:hypothetical protein